ncbi:mas-related G-protein coupled receptor member X4-like [Talpa occidentalis]|uniref:mas-related G-protein coupled receptor member X4-like n=1 Tax=Talpa occidentalis TaxID=50954 RepID=UPI00188E90E4|nr:mas-related G-protein coupled receptor member X4-like [Talpa occidentalis]
MVAEPSDPSLGPPPTLRTWSPGSGPWSYSDNGTQTSTSREEHLQVYTHLGYAGSLVTVLVSACGLAGDGAVIWLLGFRGKRTPFSVYVLHLACADAAFLAGVCVKLSLYLAGCHERRHKRLLHNLLRVVLVPSYLAGLSLLVAVSAERCVSVLWPLWHRCRRPARLSSVVCGLIWALSLGLGVLGVLCDDYVGFSCREISLIYYGASAITFLGLCASGLTLLVRVQCGPWRRRPSRLYVTLLLSALAFLLLGLPYGVVHMFHALSPSMPYDYILLPVCHLLSILNCLVNPLIYFFVGSHGRRKGLAPLRDVLQRALRDEEEGPEQSSTSVSRETEVSP